VPKVSLLIPVYNQERIVRDTLRSALAQEYKDMEILVSDDCSTDKTYQVCQNFPVTLSRNKYNLGFTGNFNKLINEAKGEYIIFLCGDDVFCHPSVISDMVKIFENNSNIGVIGRYYYQYLDGYPGAVMTIRGDIFTSSCQPSGIGFRRKAIEGLEVSDKIFVEIPLLIKQILDRNWHYRMIKYDTIAARLHPGVKGNAATNPSYYKTTPPQSPTRNWYEVLGKPMGMYMGFIQIKNRASWMLLSEIKETIKINPKCLLNLGFWFCVLIALIVPGWILRRLSNFYRHRVTRHFCRIIEREYKNNWVEFDKMIVKAFEQKKYLNLGAGEHHIPNCINCDITPYRGVDQVVDLSKFPLPWEDNSVDGIYCNHFLEHLPDPKPFILECHRILKKGGFLRIKVPHSSNVSAVGCLGHYRTFSYDTLNDYLGRDFYWLGKQKFKTIEQKLLWWHEEIDIQGELPKWIAVIIRIVNPIINFLIRLSPRIAENTWVYLIGGFRECVWEGEKI
jgi:glycosyltransferase involved in cell wall biosynthesis